MLCHIERHPGLTRTRCIRFLLFKFNPVQVQNSIIYLSKNTYKYTFLYLHVKYISVQDKMCEMILKKCYFCKQKNQKKQKIQKILYLPQNGKDGDQTPSSLQVRILGPNRACPGAGQEYSTLSPGGWDSGGGAGGRRNPSLFTTS